MNKAEQLESGLRKLDSGTEVLGFNAPVIGISGNFRDGDCTLAQAYYMSVVEAGGTPVVIPSTRATTPGRTKTGTSGTSEGWTT